MNEGKLGHFEFGGERVATDDHPLVLHSLPLAQGVSGLLAPGTLLKRVNVLEGEGDSAKTVDVAYSPFLSTDAAAEPCAVVDNTCDADREQSAVSVVHGTVKTRLLKTGDGQNPTFPQLAQLMKNGVFAV